MRPFNIFKARLLAKRPFLVVNHGRAAGAGVHSQWQEPRHCDGRSRGHDYKSEAATVQVWLLQRRSKLSVAYSKEKGGLVFIGEHTDFITS